MVGFQQPDSTVQIGCGKSTNCGEGVLVLRKRKDSTNHERKIFQIISLSFLYLPKVGF